MAITIRPATQTRFDDLATMVGPKKPTSNVCWCLSHRVDSKTNKSLSGTERADYMKGLCRRRTAPGVLAYDRDTVVGWLALGPRSELPVARSKLIPQVDDLPVWSVICIKVRPGHRGEGISHALLDGGIDYARKKGAPVLEGYPVDNGRDKVDTTMAFVGWRSLFEDAGFDYVSTTKAVAGGFPRVLMRRTL